MSTITPASSPVIRPIRTNSRLLPATPFTPFHGADTASTPFQGAGNSPALHGALIDLDDNDIVHLPIVATPQPLTLPHPDVIESTPPLPLIRLARLLVAYSPQDATLRIPPAIDWNTTPALRYNHLVQSGEHYTLNIGTEQCACCQKLHNAGWTGRPGTKDLVGCFSLHAPDDTGDNEPVGRCLQCLLRNSGCSFNRPQPVIPPSSNASSSNPSSSNPSSSASLHHTRGASCTADILALLETIGNRLDRLDMSVGGSKDDGSRKRLRTD